MRRWWPILLSLLCAVGGLFLLIYPLTVIQPFKYQDPGDLQRALLVFRIAPIAGLVVGAAALVVLVWNWRRLKLWARVGCAVLCTISIAAACLVRVNVFEQMFHPAGTPQFVDVGVSKLDSKDMLTAVALNGDAHAYPIREMGYHHVVNDYVGRVPIVATY